MRSVRQQPETAGRIRECEACRQGGEGIRDASALAGQRLPRTDGAISCNGIDRCGCDRRLRFLPSTRFPWTRKSDRSVRLCPACITFPGLSSAISDPMHVPFPATASRSGCVGQKEMRASSHNRGPGSIRRARRGGERVDPAWSGCRFPMSRLPGRMKFVGLRKPWE